jgi:hypothetical protein
MNMIYMGTTMCLHFCINKYCDEDESHSYTDSSYEDLTIYDTDAVSISPNYSLFHKESNK